MTVDEIHDTRKSSKSEKKQPSVEMTMIEKLTEIVSEIDAGEGFQNCQHYDSMLKKAKKLLGNKEVPK